MSNHQHRILPPSPQGWVWTTLDEITEVIRGASPRPKGDPRYFGGPIPWIMIADVTRQPGKYLYTTREGVTEAGAQLSRRIPAGDLILSNSATVCVPKILQMEGCIHDGFVSFPTLKKHVDLLFAYYWFEFVRPTVIQGNRQGVTQVNLNTGIVREMHFPLAPLCEQRRIVAKIEELFSELDKGIENLRQARSQLAVYRQALLKQAFEGKLTAEWRKTNAARLETADQLLARIQAERSARYQQQLADWTAVTDKGRRQSPEAKKPTALANLPEEETFALPSLPHGWAWLRFGDLCSTVRNGISAKPVGAQGDKILRISAVRPMNIDLDDYRFIQPKGDEFHDYVLDPGDLLFTRYNGSLRFVGVCGRFKGTERRLFPDKLIRAKLGVESVLPEFAEAALACGASRKFIESRVRTTAGQAGVSGADIKAVPLPICCVAEQTQIVGILSAILPSIEALESDIDTNLQKAEGLRQSILKKAFAGELVPQDPNDEPSSALLTRIRAERTAKSNGKTTATRLGGSPRTL